jgi:hypothetical protein
MGKLQRVLKKNGIWQPFLKNSWSHGIIEYKLHTMSTSNVSRIIVPTVTAERISSRDSGKTIGQYVSETELIYIARTGGDICLGSRKFTEANVSQKKDASSVLREKGTWSNNDNDRDLREILSRDLNIDSNVLDKMADADFGKMLFLKKDADGKMQDLTTDELGKMITNGESCSSLAAVVFPSGGVYFGAVAQADDLKSLANFMRKNYTGEKFEIYSSTGKANIARSAFKVFGKELLEKLAIAFAGVSAVTIGSMVSLATGTAIVAPVVFATLAIICIVALIVATILKWVAWRMDNTVPSPAPQIPAGQKV